MPLFLTVEQVAEKLGLTPRRVCQLLKAKVIPASRRGMRFWGVRPEDLEVWLASRRNSDGN